MSTYAGLIITFIITVLKYTPTVNGQSCVNDALIATATPQFLTSPNYPGNYANNLSCHWIIASSSPSSNIVLTIVDFHLENATGCRYDRVSLYDGRTTSSTLMQQLCGNYNNITFSSTGQFMMIVFQTDGSAVLAGFNMRYISQFNTAVCRLTLQANETASVLTSPGYPGNFPTSVSCQWRINTPSPSHVIMLHILDFHLNDLNDCANGNVTIYDGNREQNVISTLCGSSVNATYISNSYMIVDFLAGSQTTSRGFKFEYSAEIKADLCGTSNLLAGDYSQYLFSPNYPNQYPNDMDCQWIITTNTPSHVVAIKLWNFILEDSNSMSCQFDHVTLYDGNSVSTPRIITLCGLLPESTFTSSGNTLTLVFHSDDSFSDSGFKIEYSSLQKPDACINDNLLANEGPRYITSPGYPNNYLSNGFCRWVIKASVSGYGVVLNVIDFNLEGYEQECTTDYVYIYDGNSTSHLGVTTLCGQVTNRTFISTGNVMTVLFSSNSHLNSGGFKLEYTSQRMSDLCFSVNLTATPITQYFASPGYPRGYPSILNCHWRITTSSKYIIQLRSLDFAIAGTLVTCSSESVTVYDGPDTSSSLFQRFCGSPSNVQFLSTGSTVVVNFVSYTNWIFRGFRFEYTAVDRSALCGESQLTATDVLTPINSTHFSNSFSSNLHCQWHISTTTASQVIVLEMEFELRDASPSCNNEYVAIYDGNGVSSPRLDLLCGTVYLAQFTSTGSSMTVVFHSDHTDGDVILRLSYKSSNKPDFGTDVRLLDLSLPKETGVVKDNVAGQQASSAVNSELLSSDRNELK